MSEANTQAPQPQVPPGQREKLRPKSTEPLARIDFLEGVRGVLASWVMIGHFLLYLGATTLLKTGGGTLLGKVTFLAVNGETPVYLFMIISGFVICHLIESRGEPYGVYIFRRYVRLFPALACCFVMGLLVSHWQSTALTNLPWGNDVWLVDQARKSCLHRQYALANILAHIPLVHGLIPSSLLPDASGAFLGPAWSISTEWQFYLIAPLAVAAARRPAGLALLCLVVALLQVVFANEHLAARLGNFNGAFIGLYTQYFFIGGVSYFAWLALHKAASSVAPWLGHLRGMILCGAGVSFFLLQPAFQGMVFGGMSLTPFLSISVFAIWIFLFSCLCQVNVAPHSLEARIVETVGCSPIAIFLGKISYSVYMVHFPLAVVLLRFSGPFLGMPRPAFVVLFLIVGSVVTIGTAAVLYHYVEAPTIRWAKNRFHER
jgi:peptidoglycan/LPS O-acetylase OafA/YrhL